MSAGPGLLLTIEAPAMTLDSMDSSSVSFLVFSCDAAVNPFV